MADSSISILEGNTFVVSDRRGDVDASPTDTHGLFHNDTRFLSRWIFTVDGQRPNVLSVDSLNYFATQFFLVPGTGTVYVDSPLSIMRQRAVGHGFHENLTILNHTAEAKDVDVRLEADCDFADLFEVKDALAKKGECYRRVEDHRLVLGYRRERFVRETWISSDAAAAVDDRGLGFRVHLAPHGTWNAGIDVVTAVTGLGRASTRAKYAGGDDTPRPNMGASLEEWLAQAPKLVTSWPSLAQTYRRSLVDLAALRFFPVIAPGQALPAAGLPWFMTIFGRDSLLTSLQALPFSPRARAHDADGPRLAPGIHPRRLPRRGAGPHPARVPRRRAHRVRGAAALSVLWHRRRDAAVSHPARRIRAVDR